MKAVIFDRDGVLLDSEGCNIESTTRAFKEVGVQIKESEKDLIVGRHPEDYCKDFAKKYDFAYQEFRVLHRQYYVELFKKAKIIRETLNLIEELHKNKIPMALATSSDRLTTQEFIKRAKLEKIFSTIVTHEDYQKRKPSPDAYITAAKKLNIAPEECIVIEDSRVGLLSAKNAGMKCIVISHKYTAHLDLSQAELIVNSAKEITLNILNNL